MNRRWILLGVPAALGAILIGLAVARRSPATLDGPKRLQASRTVPEAGEPLSLAAPARPRELPKPASGTEIVRASYGSLAALLGASPGASTAVSIMLDLVHRCMASHPGIGRFRGKLEEMVPSYGHSLASDPAKTRALRAWSHRVLGLDA